MAAKRFSRSPKSAPAVVVTGRHRAIASRPRTAPAAPIFSASKRFFSIGACAQFAFGFAKRRELLKLVMAFYIFFAVAAVVLLAGFALRAGSGLLDGTMGLGRLGAEFAGFLLAGIALLIIFIAASLWINAYLTSSAAQLLRTGAHSGERAKADAFSRFLPVLGVGLLSVLVSIAASIATGVLGLLIGNGLSGLVDTFLSIVLSLAFLYAPYDAVVHSRGAVASAQASFRRFAAMPFETVGLLLVQVAVLVMALVAAAFGALVAFLLGVAGFGAFGLSLPLLLLGLVLGVVATLFAIACMAFAALFSIGLLSCAVERTG